MVAIAHADLISARVVGVHDGDTLTALTEEKEQVKIRLACIDSPEDSQNFGEKAKQALANLVFNQRVEIETTGQDRYSRKIGFVWLGDRLINLEMVQNGFAWDFTKYCTDKRFEKAEEEASAAGIGLWADSKEPIPPWDYRHGTR